MIPDNFQGVSDSELQRKIATCDWIVDVVSHYVSLPIILIFLVSLFMDPAIYKKETMVITWVFYITMMIHLLGARFIGSYQDNISQIIKRRQRYRRENNEY